MVEKRGNPEVRQGQTREKGLPSNHVRGKRGRCTQNRGKSARTVKRKEPAKKHATYTLPAKGEGKTRTV